MARKGKHSDDNADDDSGKSDATGRHRKNLECGTCGGGGFVEVERDGEGGGSGTISVECYMCFGSGIV
jgi:hypothetical protein